MTNRERIAKYGTVYGAGYERVPFNRAVDSSARREMLHCLRTLFEHPSVFLLLAAVGNSMALYVGDEHAGSKLRYRGHDRHEALELSGGGGS